MMDGLIKPVRGRKPLRQHRRPAVGANFHSRYFHPPSAQRGSALFVGVFLIAVVAVLAAAVALTSVTQQTGAARAFEAEQAWYAAMGRIESAAPGMLASGNCPAGGAQIIAGFTTTMACAQTDGIQEGGASYSVFALTATARRGNAATGNLVRRTARAQFTNAP